MKNEPVAWMDDFGNVFEMENQFFHIPLYTHPAKTLTELSGVEIIGMSGKYDFNYEVDIIDFAKAILRKAQENG